ncbi:MAG: hypothetical protein M1825_000411 [Sarcosagium campestre]|nr:MAG: hypothetical protein M1825_000411 [Sarcosagium campestre]
MAPSEAFRHGSQPVPSISQLTSTRESSTRSPQSDSSSSTPGQSDGDADRVALQRPGAGGRKRSRSNIISRDSGSPIELTDEVFDEDDARCMSPRRNSEDIEKMSRQVRLDLQEQARALQERLLALVDRVESVKSEHDKLEGENKFLQSYIGELMSTSKITSSGAGKSKGSRSK